MNEAFLAHELRTPLTLLRGYAEIIPSLSPEKQREIAQKMVDVTQEMERTIETLLRLAHPSLKPVDLSQLVKEADPVWVLGDLDLLKNLLQNLVENAKRHGKLPFEIRLTKTTTEALLSVSDAGEGPLHPIAPFRSTRGTGLGLVLVQEIAKKHNGFLEIVGASFTLHLPLLPQSSESAPAAHSPMNLNLST